MIAAGGKIDATAALGKALWGTKWLETIGDSLKATLLVIEQAREEILGSLSEVKPYYFSFCQLACSPWNYRGESTGKTI